jgi:hypothetical protein
MRKPVTKIRQKFSEAELVAIALCNRAMSAAILVHPSTHGKLADLLRLPPEAHPQPHGLLPWTYSAINAAQWNSMGFTRTSLNPRRSAHHGPWTQNPRATNLLKAASNVCDGDHRDVLCFHGTSLDQLKSVANGIQLIGDGALGPGFYFTLDPNEALGYACSSVRGRPVVLEIVVNGATQVSINPQASLDSLDEEDSDGESCSVSRDPIVASDFALKKRGCLKKMRIVRVHVFDKDSIGKFPTYYVKGFRAVATCGGYVEGQDLRVEYEPREGDTENIGVH